MNNNKTINFRLENIQEELLIDSPSIIIQQLTSNDLNQLQEFIYDQLSDKDGAPQVGNLQIQQFSYDSTNKTGSFRLHFDLNRQFCCSDTTSCHTDYLDFTFKYMGSDLVLSAHYFDWSLTN